MCEVGYIFIFENHYFRNKCPGEKILTQAWLSDKRAMLGSPCWVFPCLLNKALTKRFDGLPGQVDTDKRSGKREHPKHARKEVKDPSRCGARVVEIGKRLIVLSRKDTSTSRRFICFTG